MRVVVVYESVFGNTHAVAAAIADGLREVADVSLYPVKDATTDAVAAADLVVVGGPTHMHGLASKGSRKLGTDQAAKHGAEVDDGAAGPGLRAWLDELDQVHGQKGAAFDTRLHGSALLTGSAARGIDRRLRRHGFDVVTDPESFIVTDSEGPLLEGELERAHAWGASLVAPTSTV